MDSVSGKNRSTALVVERKYQARRVENEEVLSSLSLESQAALRQYSFERTMSYGAGYAPALELRSMVIGGKDWQTSATELAERYLTFADNASDLGADPTRVANLRQASALLRLSQAMMLVDTDERREIFANSAALYGRAAEIAKDLSPVLIETNDKPLAGWLHPATTQRIGSVLVIGGVEGWAMDFESLGCALAARGMDALMLDGPGQGETRFTHHHYLGPDWRAAYTSALDYLETRAAGLPIGFIGNSIGGSFAKDVATNDVRVRACVSNGGIIAPGMIPAEGTFFSKMMSFCDSSQKEETQRIWGSITPAIGGDNANYPLLIVHGGEDPMISRQIAEMGLDAAPTAEKQMVVYSDGDHCIYRHKPDRDILMSDWMREKLADTNIRN